MDLALSGLFLGMASIRADTRVQERSGSEAACCGLPPPRPSLRPARTR